MSKRLEIPAGDVMRQREIAAEVRQLHSTRPTAPTAYLDTYGCQQNEADSETMAGFLVEMGYTLVDDEHGADLVLMNTCAVREHAANRVYGNIGALSHTKREKPGQIIIVCGCMAQREEVILKIKESYRHVDLTFPPHALWRLPEFLRKILLEKGRYFETSAPDTSIAEDLPSVRREGPTAFLSVMYGCNNFCTYCIVPHVRGRERSRRPEKIVADIEKLVADGARDITLLGQNVNSYGHDLEENIDFSDLLEKVNGVFGDFLIRFMTSHPKDAGERLFSTMARLPKVAKHIHLPFQAGNTEVLKRMNRGYSKEDYLALIETARRYMPKIVLTGDVIVGFPDETQVQFADTLDILEQVRFDALFTFIFSPRPGTPAAEYDDPVPRSEKQVWFDQLLALQNQISTEKHAAYVGTRQRVLVDGVEEKTGALTGRTNGGRLVRIQSEDQSLVGEFVEVEIVSASTWSLEGQLIGNSE